MCTQTMLRAEFFLAMLCICIVGIPTVQKGMEITVSQGLGGAEERPVKKTFFSILGVGEKAIEQQCCSNCATLETVTQNLYKTVRRGGCIKLPVTPQGHFMYDGEIAQSDDDLRKFILQSSADRSIFFDPGWEDAVQTVVHLAESPSSEKPLLLYCKKTSTPADIVRAIRQYKRDPYYSCSNVEYLGEMLPLNEPLGEILSSPYWNGNVFLSKPKDEIFEEIMAYKELSTCVNVLFIMPLGDDDRGKAQKEFIAQYCCSQCATLTGVIRRLYETVRERDIIRLPMTLQGYLYQSGDIARSDEDLRKLIIRSEKRGTPITFEPEFKQHTIRMLVRDSLKHNARLCLGMNTTPGDIIRAFNQEMQLSPSVAQMVVYSGKRLPDKPLGADMIQCMKDTLGAIEIVNEKT